MSVMERDEITTSAMKLAEFMDRYHREGPFELVEGVMIPIMPTVAGHGWLVRALFVLLYQHCVNTLAGEVFSEQTFALTHQSDWVKGSREPDLLFFEASRWSAYVEVHPDWRRKPFLLIPDLAVEIISPNDLFGEVQTKVDAYLGYGVRLVWVMDPEKKRVYIYDGTTLRTLNETDTLTGGEVLPGFAVALATLFA